MNRSLVLFLLLVATAATFLLQRPVAPATPERAAMVAEGGAGLLAGPVTHVRDGDTIEVARRPVRLEGLTCDERGTPLGDAATDYVRRLIANRRMTCELSGARSHDREIGRCRMVNGPDIAEHLIRERTCGRCARYDRGGSYAAAQASAGPWRGAMPGYCTA